jgi:hypothetical protein
MSVNGHCNFSRWKCDHEGSGKDFKIYRTYNRNKAYMKCKNKSDTSNNRANGTISKSLRKYLSNILRKHEIK